MTYELRGLRPDEAMTEDEEEAGYVLTCQMTPKSDCIIRIPATSDVAKTSISTYAGELASIDRLSDTALAFSIKLDDRSSLGFLPGQYVNIQVPGHRPGPVVLVQLRAGRGRGRRSSSGTPPTAC